MTCRRPIAATAFVLFAMSTAGCASRADNASAVSVVGAVTVVPNAVGAGTLHDDTPLSQGVMYAVDAAFSDRVALQLTAPVDGISTRTTPGLLGVYNDVEGLDVIVEVIELRAAYIFTDHAIDLLNMPDRDLPYAEVPADPLRWFADQAGVTTSGLQDSTVLGYPARSLSYEIGDVAGAKPCFPGNDAACLTWFATNAALIIWPVGYRGTLSEIDVAGDRLLVNVRERPNAAATAAGLTVAFVGGAATQSSEVGS